MRFEWSDAQQDFKRRVLDFLRDNLPADWDATAQHGPGSDKQTQFSRTFCKKLAQAGLLTPNWPRAWGGEDLDPWCQRILAEEMWSVGEPRGAQYMNVNWIGPALIKYGTDAQRQRYVPPMSSGDAIWCQGFSEPDAGSDLASLRTRATADGDIYRIQGQKIWTSYASAADMCFLLVRTAADSKHGISILLVPMNTPGIEVRRIPSLVGEGDIHEVFFDNVEVPRTVLLGAEGQAWEIISTALANERIGIPRYAFARRCLDRAVARLRSRQRFADRAVRLQAATAAAFCEAARLHSYSCIDMRARGLSMNAEASAARVATVMAERKVAEFVVEFLPEALSGGDGLLEAHHQRAIVAGIASGAAEVQLNIVATDLLHLPREPR